jgi:hypothetical protein
MKAKKLFYFCSWNPKYLGLGVLKSLIFLKQERPGIIIYYLLLRRFSIFAKYYSAFLLADNNSPASESSWFISGLLTMLGFLVP